MLRRWEEAVGPLLAAKSVPDRYDKGTVWVATQGSAWAQELRLMKPLILERLEAMAGERGMFLDVRFGVRPPKGTLPPTGARARRRGGEPARASRSLGRADHAKGPDPIAPVPEPPKETGLSIRERAARRLANWPKDE